MLRIWPIVVLPASRCFRGDTATKWSVESLNEGRWIRDSTTGLMIQPFWRQARVVYRQNRLLNSAHR